MWRWLVGLSSVRGAVTEDFMLKRLGEVVAVAWSDKFGLASRRTAMFLAQSVYLQAKKLPITEKSSLLMEMADRFFATIDEFVYSQSTPIQPTPIVELTSEDSELASAVIANLDSGAELTEDELDGMIASLTGRAGLGDLLEIVCKFRAKLAGFDLETWSLDVQAFSHTSLRNYWIKVFEILEAVIPPRVLTIWDRQLASQAANNHDLRLSAFSLTDITTKVSTALKHLTSAAPYYVMRIASVTSLIVWQTRLREGRGSPAELAEAAEALATVDLSPVLLENRKTAGLFSPPLNSRISVADFKRETACLDQRRIEAAYDQDETELRNLVLTESRLVALKSAWPVPNEEVEGYENSIRHLQRGILTKLTSEIGEAIKNTAGAVPTAFIMMLEDLTLTVTPALLKEARTLVTVHGYDPTYKRECALIRGVTENPQAAEELRKEVQVDLGVGKLSFRLRVVRNAFRGARESSKYTAVIEGLMATLSIWAYQMQGLARTVANAHGGSMSQMSVLGEVDEILEENLWAFIEQRRRLELPPFVLRQGKNDKGQVLDQVRAFISLRENESVDKFKALYFTELEAIRTREISVYAAVISGIPNNTGKVKEVIALQMAVRQYLAEKLITRTI